jgi:hypothetical protein
MPNKRHASPKIFTSVLYTAIIPVSGFNLCPTLVTYKAYHFEHVWDSESESDKPPNHNIPI